MNCGKKSRMVSLLKWEAVNKLVHESAVASRLKQHAIRNARGVARWCGLAPGTLAAGSSRLTCQRPDAAARRRMSSNRVRGIRNRFSNSFSGCVRGCSGPRCSHITVLVQSACHTLLPPSPCRASVYLHEQSRSSKTHCRKCKWRHGNSHLGVLVRAPLSLCRPSNRPRSPCSCPYTDRTYTWLLASSKKDSWYSCQACRMRARSSSSMALAVASGMLWTGGILTRSCCALDNFNQQV